MKLGDFTGKGDKKKQQNNVNAMPWCKFVMIRSFYFMQSLEFYAMSPRKGDRGDRGDRGDLSSPVPSSFPRPLLLSCSSLVRT